MGKRDFHLGVIGLDRGYAIKLLIMSEGISKHR